MTQSTIGQNALIQNKVFEQAINIMGDIIEDMDVEKEQKDNRIDFLKNKIRLPACNIIEKMKKLGLDKLPSSRKGDRIMDRLKSSLNNHKYNKKETKIFTLNIETSS